MKTKRKIFICLALLLTATCSFLVACNKKPPSPDHKHAYTAKEVEATCSHKGGTLYYCDCGDYYTEEKTDINPDNHLYGEWAETKPASCTEKGIETRVCSENSEHTETREIPALGHNYQNKTCTRCKQKIDYTDGLNFELSEDGTYYTLQNLGSAVKEKDIIVPAEYNGKPVKKIGKWAFMPHLDYTYQFCPGVIFNAALETVYLPDSVTEIEEEAFYYCINLKEIRLSENLETISHNSFEECLSLQSLHLPAKLTKFKASWFKFSDFISLSEITVDKDNPVYHSENNCLIDTQNRQLVLGCKTSVIPSDGSVTSIGSSAFFVPDLTSITIPQTITEIKSGAFECLNLVEIYNLSGLQLECGSDSHGGIAEHAMAIHDSLQEESILKSTDDGYNYCYDGENPVLISYTGTDEETSLPDKIEDKNYTINGWIFFNNKTLKTINVPNNGLSSLGKYAMLLCDNLTKINFAGDNIKTIEKASFSFCNNLTELILPQGLTKIEDIYQTQSVSLKKLYIPESVTEINSSSRRLYCYALNELTVDENNKNYSSKDGILYNKEQTKIISAPLGIKGKITLPDTMTEILPESFYGFLYVTEFVIPDSITKINYSAFYLCPSLTAVSFGKGLSTIAWGWFSGWSIYLSSITVSEENPYYYSSGNCIIEKATEKLIMGCKDSVIPNTVKIIGANSFYDCYTLQSIDIPDGVETIEKFAFKGCYELKTLSIAKSVVNVHEDAFKECINVETATMPERLVSYIPCDIKNLTLIPEEVD